MKISLCESEQRICKFIAKSRFERARKDNIVNAKMGSQDNEFTDLEGFAGEFAFCKLFNTFPDFSIYVRSSKKNQDNKGDVLLNGKIIDVKTTKYPNGKLIVATWKSLEKGVDYYALMTGEFPNYEFKGFMSKEEIMRPERLGDLGRGQIYIAEQKELIYDIFNQRQVSQPE